MSVAERNILPDCCEDWILEYGRHYRVGESFACLECTTGWQKASTGRYKRADDGRVFVEHAHASEGATYPFLASEDGPDPLVDRCCAKIMLRHGPTTPLKEFTCPVCHTHWTRERTYKGGVLVITFAKPGLPEPFAVQPGATRSFLVPLSAYSPPLE